MKPKTPDVRDRRLPGIAQRSRIEQPQRADNGAAKCEVGCSQTGVDEHQPILPLKQQAVAHQAGGPHYARTPIPEAPARVVNGGAVQAVICDEAVISVRRPFVCRPTARPSAARREQSARLPRCSSLMPVERVTSDLWGILSRRVILVCRRQDGGCPSSAANSGSSWTLAVLSIIETIEY